MSKSFHQQARVRHLTCIKATRGDTTRVRPGRATAGVRKHNVFPAPVGSTEKSRLRRRARCQDRSSVNGQHERWGGKGTGPFVTDAAIETMSEYGREGIQAM